MKGSKILLHGLFGWSVAVAVSGTTAVVGSPSWNGFDGSGGSGGERLAGRAYLFQT